MACKLTSNKSNGCLPPYPHHAAPLCVQGAVQRAIAEQPDLVAGAPELQQLANKVSTPAAVWVPGPLSHLSLGAASVARKLPQSSRAEQGGPHASWRPMTRSVCSMHRHSTGSHFCPGHCQQDGASAQSHGLSLPLFLRCATRRQAIMPAGALLHVMLKAHSMARQLLLPRALRVRITFCTGAWHCPALCHWCLWKGRAPPRFLL